MEKGSSGTESYVHLGVSHCSCSFIPGHILTSTIVITL